MRCESKLRVVLLITFGFAQACASPTQVAEDQSGRRDANDLMVVDCLLPGQVRRLGGSMTYLTPRRPIKSSAQECEIRGGEYVAFDRASYADSLRVWLPLAKEGEAKAQTYVGEIFEKGLGIAPDYEVAAHWYKLAANQGHGPAQINLGQLYEQGRGVSKDRGRALEWYRRAAGIDDLEREFVTFVGDAVAFQEMRAGSAGTTKKVAKLEKEVSRLNVQLGKARTERAASKGLLFDDEAGLSKAAEMIETEARRLTALRYELDDGYVELERERKTNATQKRVEALEAKLISQRASLLGFEEELFERKAFLDAKHQELEGRSRDLEELEVDIHRIENETQAQLSEYATLVRAAVPVPIGSPTIHIVDPELVLTRSLTPPEVPSRAKERSVVGRIEAPAGLMSLVINGVEVEPDDKGFFETILRVRRVGTRVQIVAIDLQGERAERSFFLRRAQPGSVNVSAAYGSPAAIEVRETGVDFGRYFAIVIGIANYERLPKLETSRADAMAVASILRDRYGFEVTTLIDADRYDILSALNVMRETLNPEDNLVVYYAGHGEYDKINDRGYWLPIDADRTNNANWISNQSITDILNASAAGHVLLVADSCYSGALTGSALPRIDRSSNPKARRTWQKQWLSKRSRTALSSGGLAPVLDGGGGEHSIFAAAFLDILRHNDDVLNGLQLYNQLAARVTWKARTRSFTQEPQYAPIRFGGHEAGDFFFVPGQ